VSASGSARETHGTVDIACDESGFVGGSLFGGTRVFAHASVHLDPSSARDLAAEVRRRTGAGDEELKASRLNRPWARDVAAWLCAADGPLAGRAVVHLTDTRLFGLARLAQVLLTDASPEGWWPPDEDEVTWDRAVRLHALLAGLPGSTERALLVCGRDLLWLTRSHRPTAPVESWAAVVSIAADRLPDAAGRRSLAAWASPPALDRARAYLAAPPLSPLSEPLLPALRWAVRHWSDLGDVSVVHDEQSALTPARVAAIADELAVSCPGRRLAGFRRIDSRDDPRVQLADLVAGVVRRSWEGHLAGVPSTLAVDHLVAPASPLLPAPAHRSRAKNISQSRIASGTSW
jgi:hypothetical protein